jgi:hypothetical protein
MWNRLQATTGIVEGLLSVLILFLQPSVQALET